MIDAKELELMKIFMPFAVNDLVEAMRTQQRFVYYTRAPIAMSILQKREIWMRKVSCMNDYREVVHGFDCISSAWQSEVGQELQQFLNEVYPGVVGEIADLYDGWRHDMLLNTYIVCLSRHDESQNQLGKLSMWRAYGGTSGVAIVIKGTPFFRTDNTINVFSSPVSYLSEDGFNAKFEQVVSGIIGAREVVARMSKEDLKNRMFNMLYFGALATKHPGFEEEQEWRVIYTPNLWPSNFMKEQKSIEVVGDEPQTVYKLPFRNNEELGVDWIDLKDILDRVIIGPSKNAHAVQEAFWDILGGIGVPDPYAMVHVSDIPLR